MLKFQARDSTSEEPVSPGPFPSSCARADLKLQAAAGPYAGVAATAKPLDRAAGCDVGCWATEATMMACRDACNAWQEAGRTDACGNSLLADTGRVMRLAMQVREGSDSPMPDAIAKRI
jgi:hypothetical protein